MDALFRKIDELQLQYKEGLIDKTDTLAAITQAALTLTLSDAHDTKRKVDKITRDMGALEKIRKIVAV